ncbi:MAG: hypothetical protein F6K22_19145 [Okeania sp. SIO2F4]|uniref:hypothetical protein n=1 Tax=Okeania sp. SIO2F4 TaxID=2607790 RepID=UPI00142CE3FC|nr:hypothetical protein [Okeania sp. SIO2F4]NES04760.1 hypothetical protein [Okeania sp. SIO2F4]
MLLILDYTFVATVNDWQQTNAETRYRPTPAYYRFSIKDRKRMSSLLHPAVRVNVRYLDYLESKGFLAWEELAVEFDSHPRTVEIRCAKPSNHFDLICTKDGCQLNQKLTA